MYRHSNQCICNISFMDINKCKQLSTVHEYVYLVK